MKFCGKHQWTALCKMMDATSNILGVGKASHSTKKAFFARFA